MAQPLQVVADNLRRDSQAAGTRLQRLNQDIAQLRREKQDTQHRYEQQVIIHGHLPGFLCLASLQNRPLSAIDRAILA